jgi:hypothetical protein
VDRTGRDRPSTPVSLSRKKVQRMIRVVVVKLLGGGDGTCGDRSAADEGEGEGGGVDQARLRRRHIENPPQASPAKAIKEVDGSGTV